MGKIEAVIGGKQKGIADQITIDPAIGCKNRCVGCYAFKSSQKGKKYHENIMEKEFDYEVFSKSIRKVQEKGFNMARVGKHCDPGDHIDSLARILECCNNYDFRCVVVSKSLSFNSIVGSALCLGDHVLHMSLGPHSKIAPLDREIVQVAKEYGKIGTTVCLRFTRDITGPLTSNDRLLLETKAFPYIITPMRFSSKALMEFYKSKIEDFNYTDGYWRPNKIHRDWKPYMDNVCGEIQGEVRCCNCLTDLKKKSI